MAARGEGTRWQTKNISTIRGQRMVNASWHLDQGLPLRLSGHTTMTCTLFALLLRLPRNGTLDFAGPGTIDTSTE
jgi:hypothetical protein